jgi:mannose-6-phosphate isomerase-like protein (cupin superfamily)
MPTLVGREHAAFHRADGEGDARWWMGSLAVIKATAQETGSFALVEVLEAEVEAPRHVHHREDETFFVLEGEVEFRIGDQVLSARPGSMVFGPRDVPHSYRVTRGPARMLFMFTPGGFEQLLLATSVPALERRLPTEAEDTTDYEALPSIVTRFGCELLA